MDFAGVFGDPLDYDAHRAKPTEYGGRFFDRGLCHFDFWRSVHLLFVGSLRALY